MLADRARLPAPRSSMVLADAQTAAMTTSVTTEDVMLAILELTHEDQDARFTTLDVAQEMGVKEYRVRAAFSWLVRFGKIKIAAGEIVERMSPTFGEKYPVTLYRMLPKSAPADFDAIYRAFGLRPAAQSVG
jgi:hypothetical protein